MGNDETELYKLDKKCLGYKYTDNKELGKFSCTERAEIKKHSENIIDLIEVKDFIEVRIGDEVVSKFLIQDEHILESTRIYVREGSMKIMAVVTQEQFNSIKYEVE